MHIPRWSRFMNKTETAKSCYCPFKRAYSYSIPKTAICIWWTWATSRSAIPEIWSRSSQLDHSKSTISMEDFFSSPATGLTHSSQLEVNCGVFRTLHKSWQVTSSWDIGAYSHTELTVRTAHLLVHAVLLISTGRIQTFMPDHKIFLWESNSAFSGWFDLFPVLKIDQKHASPKYIWKKTQFSKTDDDGWFR